ncbi:MAG: hypothetical protein N3B21_13995 [Clostridia bacterium]|nr:hypothetical protein [Clostridia bacterium]
MSLRKHRLTGCNNQQFKDIAEPGRETTYGERRRRPWHGYSILKVS